VAEDKRIALAALAVTAVVGVGAPVGTLIASNAHDSSRLHDEQIRADRVAIRRVLEDAAAALYIGSGRFDDALHVPLILANRRSSTLQFERLPNRRLKPIATELTRQTQELSRLTIRLGREHPATMAMIEAVHVAAALYGEIRREPSGSPSIQAPTVTADNVRLTLEQYERATERFVDAAHEAATALAS
jgi:hypothetical protein